MCNTGTERTSMKAKDNAVDVVEKRVVEKGQEEQVKKEKILRCYETRIFRLVPLGCIG